MATTVQIELLVDEKGAVQGIRSFDGQLKGTKGTAGQLDATLKQLNTTLDKTATSGANAGTAGSRAMRQVKQEALSTREGVKLATEEFDIRMPRAFKNLISQSKLAQSAISAIGPALMGIGAIQIGALVFSQLYQGAKKLWEEHLSLTKAADDYAQELEKIKQQDFGNTRSIATTQMRIQEATRAIEEYRREADAAANYRPGIFSTSSLLNFVIPGSGALAQWAANRSASHDLQQKQYDEQRQLDKLQHENLVEQQHEQRMAQIDLNHARDEELTKEQRITAELQKQQEILSENARYGYERETARGNVAVRNPVATTLLNTGKLTPEAMKELQAAGEADAQRFQLQKEKGQELRRMQEEALEASLRGVQLYRAQEAFAIEELKAKDIDSVAARKAVHDKFHAEELKRLHAEDLEIQKMHEATALSGLTGIAKIRQEGQNKISDLYAENAQTGKMNPGQLLAAGKEIADQTAAQVNQVYQTFSDRVDSLLQQSTDRTLQGFARIHAEAQRQIQDLEREYREKGGKPADLTRGEAGIHADESRQVSELQERNADETAKIEAEARTRSLSAEKQQTLAIQSEYDERVRQYQQELDQQMISQEDFNRRVAAAEEERNAQMVESARAAREKMAGEFTRFFRNPLDAMKEMGEKAAGETAAALWQRVQGTGTRGQGTGTRLPFPGIENWGGGGFSGIFARLSGAKPGQPAAAAPETPAHRAEAMMAAASAFSVASAEIRVGMANITMAGGAGAAGNHIGGLTEMVGAGSPASSASSPGASFTSFGGGSTSLLSRPGVEQGGFAGAGGTEAGGGTSAIATGIGDAQKSMALINKARSFFTPASSTNALGGAVGAGSTADASSPFQIAEEPMQLLKLPGKSMGTNGGMLGGGGVMANAGGALGGAMGLFSAYEGNGGFGGALSGAMSGMEFGAAVGGPIGAAVGLVGGAVLGAIGFGGREKGRVYDLKQVRPRLKNDFDAFQAGSMDYMSAYSDMQALDQEARKTLDKMGGAARGYYWDTINHEIKQAEGKLTAEQKAGRSMYTMSAAQFDQGGWADDFGAMATGPGTGLAHLRRGEFVVNEQPAAEHAGALEAIRAGASHAEMGRYYGLDAAQASYRAAMQSRASQAASSRSTTHNWNVKAWDSKSVAQMLLDEKHGVRAAMNASYDENSGGSDAGF
jgi:hypothetical protein